MLLEAILTKADLDRVLGQFLPAEIQMGEGGNLALEAPTEVTLVPDAGLRLVCRARLHWPIMGLHVPVDIHPLILLMHPRVEARPDGDALVFKLKVEHADIALSPKMIDDRITARINQELVDKRVELAWNFQRTLSQAFDLPAAIQSSSAFVLDVKHGVVKVTESAIAFGVSLDAAVRRRGTPAARPRSLPRPGANGHAHGHAKNGYANGRPRDPVVPTRGPAPLVTVVERPLSSARARTEGPVRAVAAAGVIGGLALLVGIGLARRFA